MLSLPEGARIIEPVPVCDECGSPATTDSPLYGLPPGTGHPGNQLCTVCTTQLAQSILTGNREQRRRREFAHKHKGGSATRKRKKRR